MEIIFLESSFTVLKYGRDTQQWTGILLDTPQDWKRSVFIPIPMKDNANTETNEKLYSKAIAAPT